MAFDRTKPPGEEARDQTPEASYSREFGHTYVPMEEVQDFWLLSESQSRVLAVWAERLIPAEGQWPSAPEVDAHVYVDNCAARSPLLRSMLVRSVDLVARQARESHGRDFAECTDSECDQLLEALESGPDGALFDLVLELVFEGYYRAPPVLRVVEERTGFQVTAPVEGVEIEPFDETLLQRVKMLPAALREVQG